MISFASIHLRKMKKQNTILLSIALFAIPFTPAEAQCPVGELEVTIQVNTDDYGNETYWQLVPVGNNCGVAPIFSGGNPVLNCASANGGTSPTGGYADNAMIPEGPFCLTEGAQYDIICIDSYGDGQAGFSVFVDGQFSAAFDGEVSAGFNRHTFTVMVPVARDIALISNTTGFYCEVDLPVTIAGIAQNVGTETITSYSIAYSLDGGVETLYEETGVNYAPGMKFDFLHNMPWLPTLEGTETLNVRIAGVNGDTDLNNTNDANDRAMIVAAATPDRVDEYLFAPPTMTVVANGDQDILVPRDLDFHPDRTRNELWVINKDLFATGGSTVKFTDPGTEDQTFLYQRDPAARHFMSLPTGIAMGDNNNFATSPGIYDANGNQTGTTPFTGPTLWSADPAIYAQAGFGGLGSHLDMCHVSPRSQGIAHERWNRYWVVDGQNEDVVMYDFRADHGPGQDYHDNATILRYPQLQITRDPNDHIVSHCVVDKHTNWLYVVDHGGQRIMRLDTRSGTQAGIPGGVSTLIAQENYLTYRNMANVTWEEVVTTGLQEPSGVDVIGNKLLVSDHATGEVVVYDIENGFDELGRIATGTPGIMGIKIGPDGKLWYVNATNSTLVRLDPAFNVGVTEITTNDMVLHPNPAMNRIQLSIPTNLSTNTRLAVYDATGRVCMVSSVGIALHGLDVTALEAGPYTMLVDGKKAIRFLVTK